jgi:hypothetical protein
VRKLLAVAARELAERWILFPASLMVGFFPLVVPAFGVRREDAPLVGLVGATGLAAAAAVVIGSSMLARDAADGRLGFLFSRPVPWGTIWGGKWLAALVLVVTSGILAAIPWMAAFPLAALGGHHGGSWIRAMIDGPGWAFSFTLIVLGVGLANFGATAFRSRSPWLGLDFGLLAAGFWATRRYVAPLWLYGILGKEMEQWSIVLGLLPLALGVLVGSVAQVAVGRTDLRRAHRAMSIGLWAVIGLTLGVAGGYWQWVRSASPADVSVQAAARDPRGRWVYVEGSGAHSGFYPHGYLIDAASGRYMRRPDHDGEPWRRWGFGLFFSADGRFGAVPHFDREDRGAALSLIDLTGETPRLTEVALESSPPPTGRTEFALSPKAASIFVVHESGASLFELPSGRRMATTTIGPGWRPAALRFVAGGGARAWLVPWSEVPGPMRAEMRVVDLAADGQSKAVTFPTATSLDPARVWGAVLADADGRRIVTVDAGLHLRDGATGDSVATLAEGAGMFPGNLSVFFLADGRIVVGDGRIRMESGPPRALIRVFDRAGVPLSEMRLEVRPGGLSVGPEVAPGRIAVSPFRADFLPEDTLVIDVGEGRVVERLPGLRSKLGFWDVSCSAPAGAEATSVHFFRDAEGRLVRLDFATGERRVVAGPGAPRGERISAR